MYREEPAFTFADLIFTIGKYGLYLFLILLAVKFLTSVVHIVHGKTAMIVETLGKPSEKARMPGLHFTLPWPIQSVVARVNLQIQQINTKVGVKSKDNSFVHLPVTVQYQADDTPEGVIKAHYELQEPEKQISAYILNMVRQSASSLNFADLFENRDKIQEDVKSALDIKFGSFGYKIIAVLVDQPEPSEDVQKSFNRVIAATKEAEAAIKEAEALTTKMVGKAKAESESKELQGKGIANMRKAIAEGAKETMETLRAAMNGVNDEQLLAFMMETNRQDTLSNIGAHGNLVIIDGGSSGMGSTIGGVKAGSQPLKSVPNAA